MDFVLRSGKRKNQNKMNKSIGIVGAGLGGLSAAIRLANSGFNVDVYEQNSFPGGKASQFVKDGFRFDKGPSLLTMPFVLEELFRDCWENINDYLSLNRLEIICKYFYPDGSIINAYSDSDKFGNEIEAKTIDTKSSLKRYLNYCSTIYDLTSELFLYNSPSQILTFLNKKAFKTLFQIKKIDPFRTMHQANSSFFKDPKLVQLFDRYATYNGSNPYKAPATLNIIQHVEYNLGSFIPEGGIYSISNSLYLLAQKKGVKFHFNAKVEEIIIINKSAHGLKVDGKEKVYDIILSNVDVNTTFKYLIKENHTKEAKRYSKLPPSFSGLVFYWGVDGTFEQLEAHNIFFSKNYQQEFDYLFINKTIPDDPTIYIYISSRLNKKDAPAGKENWFVMVNAPYIHKQDWDAELKIARYKIIEKINSFLKVDISKKILFEDMLTPLDIQNNTGSYLGSIYGIASNDKFSAFRRQSNKSKNINKLFFCGGSAHPGGGIPLVILSGKIASELIAKELS